MALIETLGIRVYIHCSLHYSRREVYFISGLPCTSSETAFRSGSFLNANGSAAFSASQPANRLEETPTMPRQSQPDFGTTAPLAFWDVQPCVRRILRTAVSPCWPSVPERNQRTCLDSALTRRPIT
jgi:hypothetical protein